MVDPSPRISAGLPAPRIEGGVDAVVVGATLDGMAAAALLAKSGLLTVLVEAGETTARRTLREFAPGYFTDDADPLTFMLDPGLVTGVDLYRHGLSFAQRRMATIYSFEDGSLLEAPGDPAMAIEAVAAFFPGDGARYEALVEECAAQGRTLRGFFDGDGPLSTDDRLETIAAVSLEEMIDGRFDDPRLADLVYAEACLRSRLRPEDPFSYMALVRRWAGEAVGVQGGIAYPAGGARGLLDAFRRAGQSMGVDFRSGRRLTRILVEGDAAVGVEFDDGAQIRASLVVNALPAADAFRTQIGTGRLDIEFERALPGEPETGSIRANAALSRAPGGPLRDRLDRRIVIVSGSANLRRAHRSARQGEAPYAPLIEMTFPGAFDIDRAPSGGCVVSCLVHPAPARSKVGPAVASEIAEAVRRALMHIGADAADAAIDVGPWTPAGGALLADWSRARLLFGAADLQGYHFCGPEAQIGVGHNGVAGRRAAERATGRNGGRSRREGRS